VAALYDLDIRLTSRVIWGVSLRTQAGLLAQTLRDGPVLDVPAGTGLVTAEALRSVEAPPLVVAVDLSRQMLLRSRSRLRHRAVFVEADVARLPFRDGAFAAAHSANGFHLFPDAASAAREISRVCRPGGKVVVTTWTDQGHLVARLYQRLLARLGHIERPRSPTHFRELFEGALLQTEKSQTTGTLLQWTGRRKR
jgi:ubiquinone/menaquinone biosynthesis C-methylase UbiE